MGLQIELVPFTELDPREFGREISATYKRNRHNLQFDFPGLARLYGSPRRAADTIRTRQDQMGEGTGFAAHAVMLGRQPDSEGEEDLPLRFAGITSRVPCDIPSANGRPSTNEPGLKLAAWLDSGRPRQLRKVGPSLMRVRIDKMVEDTTAHGRPWTLIRPENGPSVNTWIYEGYRGGGFESVGEPGPYPSVLNDGRERQLYVARFTLEQLRSETT